MFRYLFALLLFFLWRLPAFAQGYFNERYTNSNSGYQSGLTNIVPLDSGGYLGFGQADNYPYLGSKVLQLRWLDAQGQQTQLRYFGQPGRLHYSTFDAGLMVVPGGYALAGSVSLNNGENQATLWRFSSQGDSLWYHQYDSATIATSACRTLDGGYMIVGNVVTSFNPVDGDVMLLRTDSLGNKQWLRHFGMGFSDEGYSIAPTPDGGFLVGGVVTYQTASTNSDAFVYKLDSLGNEQWHHTYGGSREDNWSKVRVLSDGNYLVAMSLWQAVINGYHQYRTLVVKLTPQGQELWRRYVGPTRKNQVLFSLLELADGSVVIAGSHSDPTGAQPVGNGYPEGFAFKLCADGDSVWFRSYKKLSGSRSHNYLRDFRLAPDGGFIGAGFLFAVAPDTGSNDSWAFKVDAHGYLQPGGTPPMVPCAPLGIAPPASAVLVDLWPNPTPDGHFTLEAEPGATLTITDALGRTISTTSNLAPGTSHLLPRPGLYLLRLTWPDGRSTTHKLLRSQ